MKPILVWFALLPFLVLDLQSQASYVQVISREKGFGKAPISVLMEDHQGIIWAATQLGLLRFDGLQTKAYLQQKGNTNSLSNEFVYDLFEDKNYMIWLATRNGLTRYDPSQNRFTRFQMDSQDEGTLPNNRIFSLLQDSDSTFFLVCDRSGLASFNINTERVTRLNPKVHSEVSPTHDREAWVTRVFKTANGRILVGTGFGMYQYDRQMNLLVDLQDSHTAFKSIPGKGNFFCSQDGMVWFLAEDRSLYKWLPDQELTHFGQPELITALKPGRLRMMNYDQDHILITTQDDYVLVNKENGNMRFLRFREDQHDLLEPDEIVHCLETQNGIVMLGSSTGDLFLINPLLQDFKYKEILNREGVSQDQSGICDFFDDLLYRKRYISSFADSMFYVEDLTNGQITRVQKLNHSNIASRWLMDQSGKLWLCNSTSVMEIDRDNYEVKTYFPETPALNLFEMIEISPGLMLVGSFQQGLYSFNPEQNVFRKIPEEKGWIGTQVFSLKLDPDHHSVWIGTVRNGLFRYDMVLDSFIQYTYDSHNKHSIGGDWVRDITIDSAGRVWFSTDPIGLSRFDYNAHPDSAFLNLSIEDGLPSNFISGLETDQKGQIWMTSINGIASLDPSTLQTKIYGRGDGLPATRFVHANMAIANNGMVLIGTDFGYFYFHPDSLIINQTPPNIIVSDILVLNQPKWSLNQGGEIAPLEFRYKENYLTIQFSVINYTESELNTVRYIMEGLDDHWSTRTGIHEVSYTKIPPGDYTFRILAANNDGVWNEQETLIPIVIKPPFWQTTWFYILVGSLIGGLILSFYNFKLKQSIKQNKLIAEREWVKSESERQLSQLELKALRAQMNPHFIFNCLNSINRFIVVNDNDAASEYLTKFAKLIRQVLDNSRGEKVLLATEIETLKLYIDMEALRFADKFEYQVHIDPALEPDRYVIQPILIQPYVENAIWHGLMHRLGKGVLHITFTPQDHALKVIIEDNGVGREMAKAIKEKQMIQRKSHGMKVTAERMSILSKKLNVPVEAIVDDLYDSSGTATGTRVRMTLPLEPIPVSIEHIKEH